MGGTRVVSGGEDAHLRNWTIDPLSYEMSQQIDRSLANIIYVIDVSTDGYIIATGEGGWKGHAGADTFRIWQAVVDDSSGIPVPVLLEISAQRPDVGYVYSLALSPDNKWAIATGFYGELAVHQTSNLELYATTATKKKRTKAIDFSPDGSLVVSASTGGIQLRSFPDYCDPGDCELDLLLTLSHSGSWSFSTVFAPDSTSEYIELASGTDSGTIKIWTIENNLDTNSTVPVRSVDSGSVYSLAWSPDGSMIVAGGSGDITVYDSTDLSILFQNVDAHAGRVNDVAVSPDGDGFMIVSGGEDGALKLWMIPPP
jgi:WD40 repeat protein